MRGAIMYGPRDVRFEQRADPTIIEPTDAIIRMSATCVCGSDLWPYRGIEPITKPTPMGHEYCGIVEEVGSAVKNIKPGQFVVGSFFASDNTCPKGLRSDTAPRPGGGGLPRYGRAPRHQGAAAPVTRMIEVRYLIARRTAQDRGD